MSASTSYGEIPLTLSQEHQSFRLLELSPELFASLASADPPTLQFKAPGIRRPGSQDSLPRHTTEDITDQLHLCSPTGVYQLRQVSTSNSVYVLAPSSTAALPSRAKSADAGAESRMGLANDDDCLPSVTVMSAVAKVDTMLELLPVQNDARAMLTRALPLYDEVDPTISEQESMDLFLSQSASSSRLDIFSDILATDPQLEDAWCEIVAFELKGQCARAGPMISLHVWRSLIHYCALHRVDLATEIDVEHFLDSEHLAKPNTVAVAQAILAFLSDMSMMYSRPQYLRIDRTKTVSWTGTTLLQASAALKPKSETARCISEAEFLGQWEDLLPESWREAAALGNLPTNCYHTMASDGGLKVIPWRSSSQASGERAPADGQAATARIGKRKWHEKFKAQRKEVKQ